jgi:hypothetical protein
MQEIMLDNSACESRVCMLDALGLWLTWGRRKEKVANLELDLDRFNLARPNRREVAQMHSKHNQKFAGSLLTWPLD